MAENAVFNWVADEIRRATSVNRLQARGTLRLALKEMGLSSSKVDKTEMRVLLRGAVFRVALGLCGVSGEEAARLGSQLAWNLSDLDVNADSHPELPSGLL